MMKPLLVVIALSSCAIDTETQPPVAQTEQALDNCATATGVTSVFCAIQGLVQLGDGAVKIYNDITSPVTTVEKLLQFLGILPTPPSVTAQFAALTAHIDQLVGSLSWQVSETDRENTIADSIADAIGAGEWLQQSGNQPLPADSATAADSLAMVTQAEKPIAFERLYSDSVFAPFAGVIPDRPTQANGFVYDWRMGVPALVEIIGMRLQVIAAENPSFKSSSSFQTEIDGHRSALLSQVSTMLAGIRCGVLTQWTNAYDVDDAVFTSFVRCADINTGAYQSQNFNWPTQNISDCYGSFGANWDCVATRATAIQNQKYGTIWAAQQTMIIQLQRQMPLFDLRATADMLYMDTHPTQPELTARYSRIPISANTNLCLDVPNASFTNGNAVQLYTCNGTVAQHWVYDRSAQTIKNPTYNKCLDVRGGDPTPGATVQIYDCNGTDAQRWSFDASTGAIANGLGNVLTVAGTIASGAQIEAWNAGVTTNQEWYADGLPVLSL
jgi:hypothetical protein